MRDFLAWLQKTNTKLATVFEANLLLNTQGSLDKKTFETMLQNAVTNISKFLSPDDVLVFITVLEYFKQYPEDIKKYDIDTHPAQLLYDTATVVEIISSFPNELKTAIKKRYGSTISNIFENAPVRRWNKNITDIALLSIFSNKPELSYATLCQQYNVLNSRSNTLEKKDRREIKLTLQLANEFEQPIQDFLKQHCIEQLLEHTEERSIEHEFADIWKSIDPSDIKKIIANVDKNKLLARFVMGVKNWVKYEVEEDDINLEKRHTAILDAFNDLHLCQTDAHSDYCIRLLSLSDNKISPHLKEKAIQQLSDVKVWNDNIIESILLLHHLYIKPSKIINFLYENKEKWSSRKDAIEGADTFTFIEEDWTLFVKYEKDINKIQFVFEDLNLDIRAKAQLIAHMPDDAWDKIRDKIQMYLLPLIEILNYEQIDLENLEYKKKAEIDELKSRLLDNDWNIYSTDPLWLRLIDPNIRNNIDISGIDTAEDRLKLILQYTYPDTLLTKIQDTLKIEKSLDLNFDIYSIYNNICNRITPIDSASLLSP